MKFSFLIRWMEHALGNTNRVRAVIIALVLMIVFFLASQKSLDRFEYVAYDYRCMLRGVRPAQPGLAVIEISDDSIAKIGRWPWDRAWHASLITILKELGARAVVFDVIFSEAGDSKNDKALVEAIKKSGDVYLAQVVEEFPLQNRRELLTSLPMFEEFSRGSGHINLYPDSDGVMRRIPMVMRVGNQLVPQLALRVFLGINGMTTDALVMRDNFIELSMPDKKMRRLPVDSDGNLLINWLGRWHEVFQHYSYIDLVGSYARMKKGREPLIDLSQIKGKVCFVGTTASGLFDIRPTPLQPLYPAVGVNLTLFNNFLENRFIQVFTFYQNWIILLVLAVLLFFFTRSQNYFRNAFNTILLVVAYVAVAIAIFLFFSVWVWIIYPLVLIVLIYFFITAYNQVAISVERARLLKMATRDSLTGLYNIGQFKLLFRAELMAHAMRGGQSVSVLMSDVDNFKKTNDTYGHLTGDAVLRDVALAFKSCCRALDVAARYGGEEFILMLPGAGPGEAFKVAEKIRKTISSKVFHHEKGEFSTSISIGITEVLAGERDPELVIARADKALYEAKQTGKNKTVIFKLDTQQS